MKKIFSFLVLVFCLACGGKTNTDSLSASLSSLTTEEAPQVITPKNVYVIIDGSGSGSSQYAVPQLTLTSIEQLIDKISLNGGGHMYLNSIDKEANNNTIVHVSVPGIPIKPILRQKYVGEQNYQYQKVEKAYQEALEVYERDFGQTTSAIAKLKTEKVTAFKEYLATSYRPRSAGDDYSDVIGVLNSAFRSLSAFSSSSDNYVLALSDLENDVPEGIIPKKINPKPDGVQLIRVNASDSGVKSVETDTETDSFENALEFIFSSTKNN